MDKAVHVTEVFKGQGADKVEQMIDEIVGGDQLHPDSEVTLKAILSEFDKSGADDKWEMKVFRVLGSAKEGNKEPFLFYCTADDFPILEKLRDKFCLGNAGDINRFRVRLIRNGRWVKSFDYDIEKPPQSEVKPAVGSDLSGMASLAQALRDMGQRQDQLFEKLLELRQTPPPAPAIAPVDTITLIERIASMMTTLRPPQPPGPDFNSLIEVFKSGIEMGGHSVGSSEKETGIYDLIQTFMQSPLLVAILEGMKNAGGVPQNPGNVIPMPQRPPVAQIQNNPQPQSSGVVVPRPPNGMSAQPSPPTPSNDVMANVRNTLLFLNSRAANDPQMETTELYAEMLLDVLPAELVPQFLAAEGVFEQLKMIEPSVVQYKEWFTALLSDMRNQAKEELGSNPQPGYVAPIST